MILHLAEHILAAVGALSLLGLSMLAVCAWNIARHNNGH